jgi:kumamolisin
MALNPDGMRPIPGSERPQAPGSTLAGPADPTERFTVVLTVRQKPGSPELPDLQYWQDTPPGQRQYLSDEEFDETYGATEGDVDAVVDYLTGKGLRVLDKHAGHRRVVAEGTMAEMDAAFGIRLKRFRAPRRVAHRRFRPGEDRPAVDPVTIEQHEHRGFEGPAKVPAKLIGIVTAVIGLDDRSLGGPAGTGTGDPPGAAYLSPQSFAQLYNFPANSAAGQTIGLYENAGGGAAYLVSDIQKFMLALPNGPPAQAPNFFDISRPGFSNNPANVASTNPNILAAVLECTADVSIVAAVAAGVNINVYFTSND